MKKLGLAILAVVMAHAAYARAEQWSKTYTISNSPDLRVQTTDANIHVDTWDQKTIEATITSIHFKFGPGGLTVQERQSGDTVEITLRLPHEFHMGNFTSHRVDIAIHMPRQGRVNLHTGDGRIDLADFNGEMELSSGDGAEEIHHVEGRLRAGTGDGHISADGRFDALNLKTGDGRLDVRATAGSKIADEWMLHTGDGSVSLELPDNFAADLYLHTGDGHIDVNLPMTTEGRIRPNDVHGKLNGGGNTITVQTGDGSINLRKG
jgi:Putative adhesin